MRTILAFVVFIGLAVLIAYPAFRKKESGDDMRAKRAPPVAYVRVSPAERRDIRQWISATGDVLANATVSVYSEVEGELKKLLVDEGDLVKAGQIIAEIDREELDAACERATAALAVTRAKAVEINAPPRPEEVSRAEKQLEEARVKMQRAEADLARQKKLFERDISSREFLDAAEMSHAVAMAQFNVAMSNLQLVEKGARQEERDVLAAQVKEAGAALHLTEIRLQKATIKAPMTGIVDQRYFDQGAHVDTDKALFRLVDMETVKVGANVSERDLANVRVGQDVEVEVDAHGGRVFLGKVSKISPTVAADSRTAEVEILIPNKDLLLKPGMFARVRIIVGEKNGVLVVPSDSSVVEGEKAHVFVIDGTKAKLRPVTVGLRQDSLIEITSGVAEGEEVVSFGLIMLKDGMDVVIRETGKPAPASGEK